MFFQCKDRWQAAGFSWVKDEGTSRLMDILLFGPLLIATGAVVPQLPRALRATLITAGGFVIVWNALGYFQKVHEFKFERPKVTPGSDIPPGTHWDAKKEATGT